MGSEPPREPSSSSSRLIEGDEPPLDAPVAEIDELLAPIRATVRREIADSLEIYDSGTRFPRREDDAHECRDGYELHVRSEAVKELRRAVVKHYGPRGLKDVWKVIGGSLGGGVIVRTQRDTSSLKEEARLSTGAFVQQMCLVDDRLQYKLVSGTGPRTGWISTRLKAKGAERDLAVRLEPREQVATTPLEPVVLLGLMACHISAESRVRRLRHVLRSVRHQAVTAEEAEFVFALSWSAATPELAESVRQVVQEELGSDSCGAAQDPVAGTQTGLPVLLALRQDGQLSQFQHLRAALCVAESELRRRRAAVAQAGEPRPDIGGKEAALDSTSEDVLDSSALVGADQAVDGALVLLTASCNGKLCSERPQRLGTALGVWVVFGDDDDIWHSQRVAEYARAIRGHKMLDAVGVFATTTRVNCRQDKRMADTDMPMTEDEVDRFLRSGRGRRLDVEEPCKRWRTQLAGDCVDASAAPVPDDLCLEYFDLCPRLRLMHEFLAHGASSELVAHRYCDLWFNEFLCSYPRRGRELGLEVSFFYPRCWMLFYATPIPDPQAWEKSVEARPDEATINVNNGHMSSTVHVEPAEEELARRVLADFRFHEDGITAPRLARYWAAFRNTLEVYFMRKVGTVVDQRVFDSYVYLAVNGSFFKFSDVVYKTSQTKVEAACRMMYYLGQGYAKAIAKGLRFSVLWHRPEIFLQPAEAEPWAPQYPQAAHQNGHAAPHWQQKHGAPHHISPGNGIAPGKYGALHTLSGYHPKGFWHQSHYQKKHQMYFQKKN